ncbi:MAG TPA: hypothetical protein VKY24_20605 [Reyranella sp.]|nr:hypothetical protein [Reyranella sp.]
MSGRVNLPLIAGVAGSVLALVLLFVDARAALGGWLVAAVSIGSMPIGALGLLMMMRMIPGPWRDELRAPTQRLLLLLPLAAVAMMPVLLGVARLYSWVDLPLHGYRAVYLSVWAFELRTILFFAAAIAVAMLLPDSQGEALAAGGIVAFTLFDTTVVIDWLMTLDPSFHSSGFGLYGMSIQFSIAVSALILLRLVAGPAEHANVLGALLITVLLTWAYLAFMQYFIIWSGNLPQGVAWFGKRGTGGWAVLEYAIAIFGLAPLFLLFFPPVRTGRLWLMALCLVVMVGKVIELAWLVLPTTANAGIGVASAVLALIGLGALTIVVLQRLPIRRAVAS